MDMSLLFLGVLVSAFVQVIKKYLGTNTLGTLLATLILSVVCAVGAYFLKYFGWMDAFMQIITSAGAFYAFIIRNIEKGLE